MLSEGRRRRLGWFSDAITASQATPVYHWGYRSNWWGYRAPDYGTNDRVLIDTAGAGTFAGIVASYASFVGHLGNDGQVSTVYNGLEVGLTGRAAAGEAYVDLHPSAGSPDYDVRLRSTGGTSTAGNSTLQLLAGTVTTAAPLVLTRAPFAGYLATTAGSATNTVSIANGSSPRFRPVRGRC
jgi:hypothetical protein